MPFFSAHLPRLTSLSSIGKSATGAGCCVGVGCCVPVIAAGAGGPAGVTTGMVGFVGTTATGAGGFAGGPAGCTGTNAVLVSVEGAGFATGCAPFVLSAGILVL